MSCKGNKNEDEVSVKGGVSVTQLKQTIVRYCLLSWTMCFSNFSVSLRDDFKTPEDFNRRHLLTFDEFKRLETANESSIDAWKCKWPIPLLWANTLICQAHTRSQSTEFKFKDFKEVLKATKSYQRELHAVYEGAKNQIPDLMTQALRVGVWFWLFLGIFSAQGLEYAGPKLHVLLALLFNLPLMHIVEYSMMFGWLHAASYLQNAFGYDE